MADWTTISSLATAGGTLVLAVATFSAVRSSNRSARLAEHAFSVGVRPLVMQSRLQDVTQKVMWSDQHWAQLGGGRANVELDGGSIYLAISLRNVGAGIGVLQAWRANSDWLMSGVAHGDPDTFHRQTRDLFVPAGEVTFWQAAIRDAGDPDYPSLVASIKERRPITIELLYTDHEGGQRAITRFLAHPPSDEESSDWLASIVRYWDLDNANPR